MRCPICGTDKAACGPIKEPHSVITLPQRGDRMANKGDYVADRRLYLDKDGKVVEAKDPTKASLLVAAGNTLPEEVARKYGLIQEEEEGAKSAVIASDPTALAQIESGEEAEGELEAEDDDAKPAVKPSRGRKKR